MCCVLCRPDLLQLRLYIARIARILPLYTEMVATMYGIINLACTKYCLIMNFKEAFSTTVIQQAFYLLTSLF